MFTYGTVNSRDQRLFVISLVNKVYVKWSEMETEVYLT